MAKFMVDFPDDFMKKLFDSNNKGICIKALEESAPILEESMKSVLRSGGHELSGELIKSIKTTKAKEAKTGAYITKVMPTGYSSINSYSIKRNGKRMRKYPLSNNAKALFLEYGVNGRQPARPFIDACINKSSSAVLSKMQEVYNREVGAE